MRVTVIGAGIIGLGTALALVERGADVTVVEAAAPMGARSAGGTRVFRLAHATPELVDAGRRARELWAGWAARAGHPLIGREGTVVSGPRVSQWAAAMAAAGVEHRVGEAPRSLPGPVTGPVLLDPGGGVLDLAGTGAMLLTACTPRPGRAVAVDPDGSVTLTPGAEDAGRMRADRAADLAPGAGRGIDEPGPMRASRTGPAAGRGPENLRADAVVVAAGAGTPALLRPLDVDVPDRLVHHVRFSFRLRRPGPPPPCHLDGAGDGVLASTYQHRTDQGLWAVGGHLPDGECALERGVEAITERWRAVVPAYAAAHLPGVDPDPVDELPCTPTAGLGDGVHTARVGAVYGVWGENLAKLAPLVADRLADAVFSDRSPAVVSHDIGPGRFPADHGR